MEIVDKTALLNPIKFNSSFLVLSNNFICEIESTNVIEHLRINNIVRSKCIFVESNKIQILFADYIFGLTFQSPSSR